MRSGYVKHGDLVWGAITLGWVLVWVPHMYIFFVVV